MNDLPADAPSDVVAEEGEVLVEGPGGVAYSFTPRAALETSARLLRGSMEAEGQLSMAELAKTGNHRPGARK